MLAIKSRIKKEITRLPSSLITLSCLVNIRSASTICRNSLEKNRVAIVLKTMIPPHQAMASLDQTITTPEETTASPDQTTASLASTIAPPDQTIASLPKTFASPA